MKRVVFLIAAAVVAISCNKQQVYSPGEPDSPTCYRVYFPDQLGFGSHLVRTGAPHEFTFKAARERTDGAITVPVNIDATSAAFKADPIHFGDGEAETTFTVRFDGIEEQVEHRFDLTVTDPQYVSQYRQVRRNVSFSVLVGKRKITPNLRKDWRFRYYSGYYYVDASEGNYGFYTVPASAGDPKDPEFVQKVLEEYNEGLEDHYATASFSIKTDYSTNAWAVFTGSPHYCATPKSSGATTPGDQIAFMIGVAATNPYSTGDYQYITLTLQ